MIPPQLLGLLASKGMSQGTRNSPAFLQGLLASLKNPTDNPAKTISNIAAPAPALMFGK